MDIIIIPAKRIWWRREKRQNLLRALDVYKRQPVLFTLMMDLVRDNSGGVRMKLEAVSGWYRDRTSSKEIMWSNAQPLPSRVNL